MMAAALAAKDSPALAEAAPVSLAGRAFRPDVEGLRAIAVLLVIAAHAGMGLFPGGYVGVDVFFVLSGFLITGLLLKNYDADHTISLTGFYARRVRRILPASTLVLVSTVIGSYVYLSVYRATHIAGDAQWTALFAANLNLIRQSTNYFDSQLPPSPLQHFWSLGVEEQFYAVWPLAIVMIALVARNVPMRRKLGAVLCLVIAVSLWWSIVQTAGNGAEAYFSPLTRAWELGAGALIAVVTPSLSRLPRNLGVGMSLGGVLAILAAGLLFTQLTPFPGYAVVLPAGGAALAVAGGTVAPGGGAEIVLRLGLFQWLGKLSYSLYLWHWPLLTIAQEAKGRALSAGETLILFVGTLALSSVTFQVVEQPVRSARWLKCRSPFISIALGACLVAVSFGIATGMLAWLGPHAAPTEAPTQVVFP
jgi:peptidoglycan/LPS O-acetylase OafA/YrhL